MGLAGGKKHNSDRKSCVPISNGNFGVRRQLRHELSSLQLHSVKDIREKYSEGTVYYILFCRILYTLLHYENLPYSQLKINE